MAETTESTLEKLCDILRRNIKITADDAKGLLEHSVFNGDEVYSGQHSEMKANIMLAYRHLEDARMRVGKIIQAAGDGVSILDKPPYKPI